MTKEQNGTLKQEAIDEQTKSKLKVLLSQNNNELVLIGISRNILERFLALLEQAEPEAGELKYCKEHRTIHCSCQQREIDRLTAENKAQAERIEKMNRYVFHHPNCAQVRNHFIGDGIKACTCGFDQALKGNSNG